MEWRTSFSAVFRLNPNYSLIFVILSRLMLAEPGVLQNITILVDLRIM